MIVALPLAWVVVVDFVAWAVVSAGAGYVAHRLPARVFAHDHFPYAIGDPIRTIRFYERLSIRRWKDRLPEAGALFSGGFSKRDVRGRDRAFLERFVVETRRAEFTHWVILLAGPFFLIWNPWGLGIVMIGYAVIANVPCLVVQRYNRARLVRALRRMEVSAC